ncbi:hypothetical protein ACQ4PT_004275 [Festuca glaucescens]
MALAALSVLPHVAIFPFMAKGHTIPLIQLVHHLRRRRLATVTFFTTHGNTAFMRDGLSGADGTAVVELAFPDDVPGVPAGVESAEGLTSMASFVAFTGAVSLLQPQLEAFLAAMETPASLLVADAFLYWANALAARLGVAKVSFFGMSAFAQVMRELRIRHDPCAVLRPGDVDGDGNPTTFTVPEFPHMKLTPVENGVFAPCHLRGPHGAIWGPVFGRADDGAGRQAGKGHRGELWPDHQHLPCPREPVYIEIWNKRCGPKAWTVGPLCLSQPASASDDAARPPWMAWLDEKAATGRAVLYVALGTLAAIPEAQLKEVTDGLERAEVDFIWAVRPENIDLGPGFEDRTKKRGLVVREWVDQPGILWHESVRGFLSHCRWNSVLESVTAGVPLAVWPMQADQPFNARFVVEELKIAVRLQTSDGTMRGLVTCEEVSRVVRELMLREVGTEAAKNVADISVLAKEADLEGGSSWKDVEEMIRELCAMNVHVK